MRADVRADIAATVIVGGFMEGLIGPLSPLNRQQESQAEAYRHDAPCWPTRSPRWPAPAWPRCRRLTAATPETRMNDPCLAPR